MTWQAILIYLCTLIISYLCGAIPNGVIISKCFFKVDVRDYGSHNSGGTNAGRVLGKKAGLAVMILDALKIIVPFWIIYAIVAFTPLKNFAAPSTAGYVCLFSACIGHCYSPYIGFRGGKAVATFAGCLLATNWLLFIIFIAMMFLVLKLSKIVSLSSLVSATFVTLLSLLLFIPQLSHVGMWPALNVMWIYQLAIILNLALLIIRHRANIIRIKNGEESKITWMK